MGDWYKVYQDLSDGSFLIVKYPDDEIVEEDKSFSNILQKWRTLAGKENETPQVHDWGFDDEAFQMKKFVIVLAIFLFPSCFLFPGNDYLTDNPTTPPVEENDDGTVTFTPTTKNVNNVYTVDHPDVGVDNNSSTEEPQPVTCQIDEIIFKEGPYEVKPSIQFVYKTFDGVYGDVSFYQRTLMYEYVFLKSLKATALSGDDLRFVSYANAYLYSPQQAGERELIAWGGPFEKDEYVAELDIKGDLELSPFIYDEDTVLYWELRGKSPSKRTYIEVEATFIGLYFCE